MGQETFWTLLRDPAHWQFELFVGFVEMLVVDVLVLALIWPRMKRAIFAHIHHDICKAEQGLPLHNEAEES